VDQRTVGSAERQILERNCRTLRMANWGWRARPWVLRKEVEGGGAEPGARAIMNDLVGRAGTLGDQGKRSANPT
jgi:hypothetical protein